MMKTLQQLLKLKEDQAVISISPLQTVYDALVMLAEHHIGALAVIDNKKLVGIFSERDYARQLELKGRLSKSTKIHDVMSKELYCAGPDDTTEDALNMMSNHRVRHLPVLQGENLLGILSTGDLVKETISYQQALIQQLESYIHS
jgi:CBS domain-containing protein